MNVGWEKQIAQETEAQEKKLIEQVGMKREGVLRTWAQESVWHWNPGGRWQGRVDGVRSPRWERAGPRIQGGVQLTWARRGGV